MVASEPGLWTLAGAYFHQDYELEAPNADGVIELYARESGPDGVSRTVAQIEDLLAGAASEDGLKALWRGTYHSAFDPADVGLTYRAWFEHMLQILRDSAAW